MATSVIADNNQSMVDLVVQGAGSLQAAITFCKDNGVSITGIPVPGDSYIVSDEALAKAGTAGAAVRRYLQLNGLTVGTLGAFAADVLRNDDGTPLRNDDGQYLKSDT